MKRKWVIIGISVLFILLFVYTAVNKLWDYSTFKRVLTGSPLVASRAYILAWLLPVTELVVALALVAPSTRNIGLWSALGLMLVFTVYLGYMIYFTPHRPCGCGGVLRQMSWKQHLVFNVVCTLLAGTGVILSRKKLTSTK